MKHLIIGILILSLSIIQLSELLVYVSFKLNQDYIANNLCVEKDVEGSACKGCCQLKKRMEEQQESKKALPPVQSEKQNIDFWNQSALDWVAYFPQLESTISEWNVKYRIIISYQIFHPPKCCQNKLLLT
ncbi:MAG: hypothetical protein JXR61_01935 [Prolixibacteraceae bacterium]|nr:hypothetical protein [Prolixibacteraceae bacterium]